MLSVLIDLFRSVLSCQGARRLVTAMNKKPHLAYLSGKDLSSAWSGAEMRIVEMARHLTNDFDLSLFHRRTHGSSFNSRPRLEKLDLAPPLESSDQKSLWPDWQCFQNLRRIHRQHPFDMLLVSHIAGLPAALLFMLRYRVPMVFDDHNVESEVARFERGLIGRMGVGVLENIGCRVAKLTLAVSERDASILSRFAGKVGVVPNGTGFLHRAPNPVSRGNTVLFFGNMNYAPNRNAAEFIAGELAPSVRAQNPHVCFRIIGRNAPTLQADGVDVLGYVDDLVNELDCATLVVVPITDGSGTRIKILDSLARGKPIISTDKGAEGLPEFDALCIASLEQFSDRIIDHIAAHHENGYRFSEADETRISKFGWEKIAGNLVPALNSVLASHSK